MDTHIIIPTIICVTIAIIFLKKFNKKKVNKVSDTTSSSSSSKNKNYQDNKDKNDIKETTTDDNNKVESNEKGNEKEEEEEEEEEKENEEKIEKEKQKKKELTFKLIFDKFCNYVQKNKLVSIDEISKKLKKTKEETILFLRELENEGKTIGFIGDDGEYFYLTSKEFELLNNILLNAKKKEFTEEELEKQFQEIVKDREDSLY